MVKNKKSLLVEELFLYPKYQDCITDDGEYTLNLKPGRITDCYNEKRLLCSIILQAIIDSNSSSTRGELALARLEARNWLKKSSYGFRLYCDVLGIDLDRYSDSFLEKSFASYVKERI